MYTFFHIVKFDVFTSNASYYQGWGVAVIVGVPTKDAEFKTHPINFMEGRTLKGTFYGNFKTRSDIPSVVEKYMNKVNVWKTLLFNFIWWCIM